MDPGNENIGDPTDPDHIHCKSAKIELTFL